jgi:hypothetical protein
MNDHGFSRAGTALRDTVAAEVDTLDGLDRLRRRHRTSRLELVIVGSIAVLAIVLVTAAVVPASAPRVGQPPASGAANPSLLPSTELPITVHIALLDGYVIEDEAAAHCTGSGAHEVFAAGAPIAFVDAAGDVREALAISDAGALIDVARAQAMGLPTNDAACLFDLGSTSRDEASLVELAPDAGGFLPARVFEAGWSQAGRQFVFHTRIEEP